MGVGRTAGGYRLDFAVLRDVDISVVVQLFLHVAARQNRSGEEMTKMQVHPVLLVLSKGSMQREREREREREKRKSKMERDGGDRERDGKR